MSGAAAIRFQGDVARRAPLGGAVDRGHGAGAPAGPIRTGAKDIPFRWVPLAPLVVAMSLGIVADRFVEPWPTRVWIAMILACGAIAALTSRRNLVSSLTLFVAFGAIGGGWHHDRWWDRDRDDLSWSITEIPRSAWVRGVIRDALGVRRSDRNPYGSGAVSEAADPARSRTRFVVDLTAISDGRRWNPVSGRAMVIVTGDRSEIRAGEAIEAAGQLARIPGPLNPGEFDYRDYLRGQGIDLRLTVDDTDGLGRDPQGRSGAFVETLGRLRTWSRSHLVNQLDPTIEPLAAAFLLGQREGVEPEVNDAFARTGTTHLLAISGLHLQVLAVAMLLAARAIGLPRRPAHLTVALLTIGYAALVGAAPSVVRSTVMTVTFCLAAIVDRTARPANTLALAALGTLAFNPVYLFDVGCQLSFLAIAALFWLVRPACARLWLNRGSHPQPAVRAPLPARRPGATVGAAVAHQTATDRRSFDRRRCSLDRGLAGGAAAGCPEVPHHLTDWHPLEHPADPDHFRGAPVRWAGPGTVGGVGAAGRPCDLDRRLVAPGDSVGRPLGRRAALGTPLRGRTLLRMGPGLLWTA